MANKKSDEEFKADFRVAVAEVYGSWKRVAELDEVISKARVALERAVIERTNVEQDAISEAEALAKAAPRAAILDIDVRGTMREFPAIPGYWQP